MVAVVVVLLLAGMFLSAFFSGTETGFYRVNRVRLVLDAKDGDAIARGLLWLTNHPALFVATTLIGNNLANYLTSMGIVLAVNLLPLRNPQMAALLAPVALSPVVFVYGELLPKNLFYHAPNALLRRGGPLFLFFAALFSPLAALLWALGRLLQGVLGQTPLRVRPTLARRELQGVLREGQEAGLLTPAQRQAAQNLFAVASRRVHHFCTPASRVPAVPQHATKEDVLKLARRLRATQLPVQESQGTGLIGYVRVVELCLNSSPALEPIHPLPEIPPDETHVGALIRLQTQGASLARVVDAQGNTVGLVDLEDLVEPVFRLP